METHLWMASHLDKFRYKTIQTALKSIENQTVQYDKVYLSVSSADYCEEDILKLVSSFKFNIQLFFHEGLKTQFEHYYFLEHHIPYNTKKQILFFMDDDDLISPNRVSICVKALKYLPSYKLIQHNTYKIYKFDLETPFLEEYEVSNGEHYSFEYCNFVGRRECISNFFTCISTFDNINRSLEECLEYKFCDLFFNIFLTNKYHKIQINKCLYLYRRFNHFTNEPMYIDYH